MEVITRNHRLILQPLGQLRAQRQSSIEEEEVALEDNLDLVFKSGLMRQVQAFLYGEDRQHLLSLLKLHERWPCFEAIGSGGSFLLKDIPK